MKIKTKVTVFVSVVALIGALACFSYQDRGGILIREEVYHSDAQCFSGINLVLKEQLSRELSRAYISVCQEKRMEVGQAYEEIGQERHSAPANRIKTYMPYQAITSRSTEQYRMQQAAYTGNYGIRQINGRYCIAVGSGYTTKIGTWLDLVLEDGTVIPCILADQKDDMHTDSTHRITFDGSLAEFVVDIPSLGSEVTHSGDVSKACPDWGGMISYVVIYDTREEF